MKPHLAILATLLPVILLAPPTSYAADSQSPTAMKAYTQELRCGDKTLEFDMVPIPGGRFKMGSPSGEADRNDDEGPQVEVAVEPFWMAKYELRSARRIPSDREWSQQDPQIPNSIWWHTESRHVGLRVVRPLKQPTADQLNEYWEPNVGDAIDAIESLSQMWDVEIAYRSHMRILWVVTDAEPRTTNLPVLSTRG